jgi:hypothetical protein
LIRIEPPAKIRVEAEYGSSGIWLSEPDGLSMLDHEEIDLPKPLSDQFDAWIEMCHQSISAKLDQKPPIWDSGTLDAVGRKLAKSLKRFVGHDVIVEFWYRALGTPESIIEVID